MFPYLYLLSTSKLKFESGSGRSEYNLPFEIASFCLAYVNMWHSTIAVVCIAFYRE